MKLEAECPKCGGVGKYTKGWDMPQRRQKKGGKRGDFKKTGKVTRIGLYKCKKCMRLFRTGETVKIGNINNRDS